MNRLKFINLFRFLFVLVIALVNFFGCKSETPELQDLADKYLPDLKEVEQHQPQKIKIAIDVSSSMKGFSTQSEFQDLLRKTFTSLGQSLEVEYYKFDTAVYRLDNFLSYFHPTTYSGYAANIGRVLDLLGKDSSEILIIITDLQFNNNEKYFDLVFRFQKEISDGSYVKLFSARTNFNGLIFPQFINIQPFNYLGLRPLYVICFGRKNHAEFIENILKRAFDWENSITLSNYAPVKWEF